MGAAGRSRSRARLRAARDTVAVMKLSGAVGTYSNIPPEVEALRRRRARAARRSPATQVIARDRHARVPVRVRIGRGDVRADGGRTPPPAAHRGARGAGGVQAGPEGLVGDAAQAQPDLGRDDLGSGPRAARQSVGGPAGRGAVARARHLALVGRAGDPARLVAAGVLRDAPPAAAARRAGRVSRADAGQPRRQLRPRVQPAGAAGAGVRPA